MKAIPKFDFGGFATKVGIKCADGRTILKDAFKHCDGLKVPLVWQHLHNDPGNILGHAILESRDDGVYAYCTFNDSEAAQNAKAAVAHGDITDMSIFANALRQKGLSVLHGVIREVSLVLSGANPGATIDNLAFAHGDGLDPVLDETEAIITFIGFGGFDDSIQHADEGTNENRLESLRSTVRDLEDSDLPFRSSFAGRSLGILKAGTTYTANIGGNEMTTNQLSSAKAHLLRYLRDGSESVQHAAYPEDATVQQVFDTLDETQKTAVYAMIADALEEGSIEHSNKEGEEVMKVNVFDSSTAGPALTHDQITGMKNSLTEASIKRHGSLKDSVLAHAAEYGIENIDVLFPDARTIRDTPDLVKRDDTWVGPFLSAIYKTPFSRIKSRSADLTEDEARAKGYITGKRKKEEIFPIMKRVTTPTTVYKKQKLDRDDIVDITDFDVVVWMRAEMRLMLEEELARAVLISDGRAVDAEDKINEQCLRPIWTDDELFAPKHIVAADTKTLDLIDEVVRARKLYKGTGTPNFYTTEEIITDMLLVRDLNQRRIYQTVAELASALRVNQLIAVEVMEEQTRTLPNTTDVVSLQGILLNPRDYSMGADKGGEVSLFDDFDIDYNQYKYLIETRVSGALTKPKSAVVIEKRLQAAG